MGQNVRASFGLFGTLIYRQTSDPPRRQSQGAITRKIHWLPNTTGAGAANASHFVTVDIPASGTLVIDLAGFTDMNGDMVTWTQLKSMILSHDASSLATGAIKITGSDTHALPGVRSSDLKAGQVACLVFDPTGDGIAVTAPNSKVIVTNADAVLVATVSLLMHGQIG